MNQRKDFIDIAKGIGIILVVLGHLDGGEQLSRYMIYAFHMPMFFMLSGVFADTKKPFKEYFVKSAKTLYLPYFILTVADAVIFGAIRLITGGNALGVIKADAIALLGFGFETNNRPLWFLFALFVIRLVYYFADKNKYVKYFVMVASLMFILAPSHFELPQKCIYLMAIPGLGFYILGNLMKAEILNTDKIIKGHTLASVLIFVALTVGLGFIANENGMIDMTWYNYSEPELFLAGSMFGTIAVIILSALISNLKIPSKVLCFFGRNSVIIMCAHYYIARKGMKFLMGRLDLSQYLYHPVTQAIALPVIMLIMVVVILIVNKYFYFVFGKSKPNKNQSSL